MKIFNLKKIRVLTFFFIFLAVLAFLSFLTPVKSTEKIPVVFFSTPGCEECALTRNYLESLKEIYPQIEITEYSVGDRRTRKSLHISEKHTVCLTIK